MSEVGPIRGQVFLVEDTKVSIKTNDLSSGEWDAGEGSDDSEDEVPWKRNATTAELCKKVQTQIRKSAVFREIAVPL